MNAVEHSQNHYHRKYYVHIWSNWSVCLCEYLFLPILDQIRGNWWTWFGVHLVLRYIIPRQLIIRTFLSLSLLSIQWFLPLKQLIRSAWHFLPIVRTQMQPKSIRTQRSLVVFFSCNARNANKNIVKILPVSAVYKSIDAFAPLSEWLINEF